MKHIKRQPNPSPTVSDILKDYLKKHGFCGLCNVDCGCHIEDFAPCGAIFPSCEPAELFKSTENKYVFLLKPRRYPAQEESK